MKEDGVIAAVELHFNSATPSAQGHEWLYWHSSVGGEKLANLFKDKMEAAYPEMKSRGAKPRIPRQRGSTYLRKTHCVAVIGEPFFGSNADEWRMINDNKGKLARVYASALAEFIRG
jgi:N-acetylmuramoyl-L-alanine amidase